MARQFSDNRFPIQADRRRTKSGAKYPARQVSGVRGERLAPGECALLNAG